MLSEVSDELDRTAAPDLASGDEPAGLDDGVGQDLAASLEPDARHDDGVVADHYVVVYNAAVQSAISFHSYILADVDGWSDAVRDGSGRVNHGVVANGREVADPDGVELSSDSHIVPHRRPLAYYHISNYTTLLR